MRQNNTVSQANTIANLQEQKRSIERSLILLRFLDGLLYGVALITAALLLIFPLLVNLTWIMLLLLMSVTLTLSFIGFNVAMWSVIGMIMTSPAYGITISLFSAGISAVLAYKFVNTSPLFHKYYNDLHNRKTTILENLTTVII